MTAQLQELGRTTQILLELHRRDPDDEHIWQQLERERGLLAAEWLRHTVNPETEEALMSPYPPNPLSTEPVLTAITGLVLSGLGLLVAFGVDFTVEQTAAISAFVAAVYGIAVLVRSRVSPTGGE